MGSTILQPADWNTPGSGSEVSDRAPFLLLFLFLFLFLFLMWHTLPQTLPHTLPQTYTHTLPYTFRVDAMIEDRPDRPEYEIR